MIDLSGISEDKPYSVFKKLYNEALVAGQNQIEAISISSYSKESEEIDSRFVNLKSIRNNQFIFFSNYDSPKSKQFDSHNQISALIFWQTINVQIRIKALITKTSAEFNNKYFANRALEKNALAISSNQSSIISSFERVTEKYELALHQSDLKKCPKFWGGFSFTPYYFEFWEGHESRLNKREAYERSDDSWKHFILQP